MYFVWYKKIIPLLQEYFYNDWEQLKLVLGDFVVESKNSNPLPEDKITNKIYEIKDFKDNWDKFSASLNIICSYGRRNHGPEGLEEDNNIGSGDEEEE